MVDEHPIFIKPSNPYQKIWRYMDFTKFVELLNSSSLYFSRADQFEDIFEGSVPKISAEVRNRQMLDLIEKKKLLPKYTPDFWEDYGIKTKKEYAINCWHMNDFESAAMWKLYLKSNEGIAIQSDYSKLVASLNPSELLIFIGTVNYIDYEKDKIDLTNGLSPYIHKRKSFSHENELRAIIWQIAAANKDKLDLSNGGINVKVDLQTLIENVYVSPDSPLWLTNLIKETCTKFGYNFNVINSKLYDKPVY